MSASFRLPGAPAPSQPPVMPPKPMGNRPPRRKPRPADTGEPASSSIDFNTMVAVTDHRDADLLADLARLTALRDQVELAHRRGKTAYNRTVKANCQECVALENVIAATPAHTSEGRRAKALHALREADPDAPCGGFTGFHATALSALWDIVQAGAL